MRVLFYYGLKLHRWQDQVWLLDTFRSYLNALAEQTSETVVLACIREGEPPGKFNAFEVPQNLTLVALPWYEGMVDGSKLAPQFRKVLEGLQGNFDRVIMRYPEPNWEPLFQYARKRDIPFTLHFVGNPIALNSAIARNSSGKKKLVHYLKVAALKYDRWKMERTIKHHARLVSNGSEIPKYYFRKQQNAFEVVISSSLTESDFNANPRSWFANGKLHVLFVGYLRNEKGIEYLLEAVQQFPAEQLEVEMVGGGDRLEQLRKQFAAHSNVTFHGHLHKQAIHALMDKSDVLIIPSLSEGTPRVLLEGLARQLFAVGTRVGGIPDVIGDNENGMLIPPASTQAIVQALNHILENPEAVEVKIRHSFEFARNHTTNAFIKKLLG